MSLDDAFARLSGVPADYFEKMQRDVPDGDQSALQVFLALRAAARRVDHAIGTWLVRNDLTVTKLDVLHLLRRAEGMSVTQMADFLRMTQPNMTFVVNGLERDGLVSREVAAHDRRTTIVRLSPVGEELVARVTPGHMHAIGAALATISPQRRADLIETLAAITDAFEASAQEGAPTT